MAIRDTSDVVTLITGEYNFRRILGVYRMNRVSLVKTIFFLRVCELRLIRKHDIVQYVSGIFSSRISHYLY